MAQVLDERKQQLQERLLLVEEQQKDSLQQRKALIALVENEKVGARATPPSRARRRGGVCLAARLTCSRAQ